MNKQEIITNIKQNAEVIYYSCLGVALLGALVKVVAFIGLAFVVCLGVLAVTEGAFDDVE